MAQPTPPQEPKDQAQQPRRLGGFELLATLGKGGMGTVFKARQVSMDRLVALKILPKKLAENEAFVQRFLREARSAAKLRHPNIVQAFDVGQAEGYYFFAMEFVDGETLSEIIRRDGPLEPNRALDIMKQVASALAAAHEAGIVHRDIKPSNIMIDKKGEVRVTDFGLAKRTEGDVEVTADGAVVGTPAYVAPEMAKWGEADARSDLYSLGATIFCALTGRPPFEGRNFSEVLIKQVNEPAPPLATLAPRVERRLCHVIDRLLRKNPETRYPSANALLDDLNGLGKLQSVAAAARAEGRAMIAEAPTIEITEGRRQMAEERRQTAAAGPKRKTTLIAVAAAVAIIAIAGLVIATRRGPRPPERSETVREGNVVAAKPPEDAKKTAVPDHRTPITEHRKDLTAKTPEDAKKTEPVAPKLVDVPKKTAPIELVDDAEAKRKAAELAEQERIAKAKEEAAEKARLEAEELRRKAEAAAAAYAKESDKLWALFKQRDYAAAEKLLLGLPNLNLPKVANLREVTLREVTEAMAADLEAAKLLKEFWGVVEKGLATRKGTVSIRGALGNITAVEQGIITIQTPEGLVTRRVGHLTAKQALAYAAVVQRDDERYRLAEAVFRIAEGEDPALADKALAAAGNPPGLSCYKDRLAALTLGAAEVAARKAWAEIEAAAKPKPTKAEAARLLALLDAFEKAHAGTKHFASVRDKLPDLRAQAQPAPKPPEWVSLFDGKTLGDWQAVRDGEFARPGRVVVRDAALVLEPGDPVTGVRWTGELPRVDYEVRMEVARLSNGADFASMAFPVGAQDSALLVGVRGDGVGLVQLDGRDIQNNGTHRTVPFKLGRWYDLRLRVTKAAVEAWLDDAAVVHVATAGRRFGVLRVGEAVKPLGFYTWRCTGAIRNIRLRRIEPGAAEGQKAGE